MGKLWKDDPAEWQKLYDDQNTVTLDSLDFPTFERTRLVVEDAPAILKTLEPKIQEHWRTLPAHYKDNPKKGIAGTGSLEPDGNTLIVRSYATSFSALMYNLQRRALAAEGKDPNVGLSEEQVHFLDNNLHILGVSAYVEQHGLYLFGEATKVAKHGMLENLPAGMVDAHTIEASLEEELQQETGLNLQDDIEIVRPWGINFSPKYGNGTFIYELVGKDGIAAKVKKSSEHAWTGWLPPSVLLDENTRMRMSPAPLKIIEALHPDIVASYD